jgi:hypothetical protein
VGFPRCNRSFEHRMSRQVVEIELADLEAALARDLETGNGKS